MSITPYLDENPEIAAFALGRLQSNFRLRLRFEFVEVVVTVNNRPVWSSGVLSLQQLSALKTTIPVDNRRGQSIKTHLHFTKLGKSYPHTVRIPLPNPPVYPPRHRSSGDSKGSMHFDGSSAAIPAATRKARGRLQGKIKSPFPARTPVPRSTNLRPSPEVIVNQYFRIHNEQGPVPYVFSAEVVPFTKYYREWVGVRTPGFASLKKRQLPVNPHSVYIVEVHEDKYTNLHRVNDGGFIFESHPYSYVYAVPVFQGEAHLASARNKAIRKLIEKAELGIDANLAQDYAQMRQLTTLIATNTTKIVNAARQAKRGNFLGAFNTLTAGRRGHGMKGKGNPSRSKDFADNWLELQYGWKPLLQDIEGTLKSLSNLESGQPTVRSVRVSANAIEEQTASPSLWGSSFPDGFTSHLMQTRCMLTLRYRVDSPMLSFLAQTGFTNPVNLIWEVLPFSFVADWFLPVGPYLEALSAWDGVTFLGGSQTLFSRCRTSSASDYSGINPGNPAGSIDRHAHYSYESVRLNRISLTGFPTMTFPSFKNGLASVTHAANGIALVKSIFHGK